MILTRKSRQQSDEKELGQSLVEIGISMVFFFFFLLGLLDLGRAYFIMVALEDSAAEAATFLSIDPECSDSSVSGCADPNNAEWRAANAVGDQLNFDRPEVQVLVEYPTSGKSTGNQVRVFIRYPFTPLTPIISAISGGQLTLVGDATQIILVE